MKDNNRVAVFIDAENISPNYAENLMKEASNFGDVIVKRVFADWSNKNVAQWKDAAAKYSLLTVQQFCAVKGKNTSDISLIIHVMLALFEKDIDVFCLASSDSDFTRLVQELRERGKTVIGLGEKKTVKEFVNSFSEFIYLDKKPAEEQKTVKKENKQTPPSLLDKERMQTFEDVLDKLIDENGKAYYAQIGKEMKNRYSDFIPGNYNCKSWKELMPKIIGKSKKYKIDTESDGTSLFVSAKK